MQPCALNCGKAVDLDDETIFFEQTVFVHGPKKNGACLAADTGRQAHAECVQKALAGIAPDMEPLFEMDTFSPVALIRTDVDDFTVTESGAAAYEAQHSDYDPAEDKPDPIEYM